MVRKQMQANLVIFSMFVPKNVVCIIELKQTTFSIHKINLPEFDFKQFGTNNQGH